MGNLCVKLDGSQINSKPRESDNPGKYQLRGGFYFLIFYFFYMVVFKTLAFII